MEIRDASINDWELLHEFFKVTGVPVLFNTSFNLGGEPIVESPVDAVKTFTKSNIDPKGEVGDGFELPGLDDAKIRKLIEDLDEEEEDPDTSA